MLQVSILRGLKERYEVHHGVRLQDAALVSAAQLSHRYIADRFLPDKAIDLVDEAAAKLNIEVSTTQILKGALRYCSFLNLLAYVGNCSFLNPVARNGTA